MNIFCVFLFIKSFSATTRPFLLKQQRFITFLTTGCVAGIYIIFFGQRNLNPFGFVQRYFFRKSVNERMSTFRNNSGLPLVNNDGLDLDPEQIAERVRNLEGLLAEYFIDTGYLEQLRKEPVHSSASWSKESASNNVSRPAQVQLPFARTRNASEDSLE